MYLSRTFIAAGLALASSAASALNCPDDIKAIDAALVKARLSTYKHAEVQMLRKEGERLQKENKHQEACETLAKAKKILGI